MNKYKNIKKSLFIFLFLCLFSSGLYAQEVYQGSLDRNKMYIMFTGDEVAAMQNDHTGGSIDYYAYTAAYRAIRLTGLDESITGIVASAPLFLALQNKYKRDFRNSVNRTPAGNALTLSYTVNFTQLEAWAYIANKADATRPEVKKARAGLEKLKSVKEVYDLVESLANAILD